MIKSTTKKNSFDIEPKLVKTPDIGLASVLVCLGYELIDFDRSDIRSIKFVFKEMPGINESINDYWNNVVSVQARTLIETNRMLKRRILSN